MYVHEVLSEALERILLTRFLAEKRQELPTKSQEVASDPLSDSEAVVHNSEEFFISYGDFFQSTLNGDNSKTAQYWAKYLEMQTMIHTAVQENNFEMRLQGWTYWIPFYFSTDLFNYAHYGTCYLETLKNIQKNYPG